MFQGFNYNKIDKTIHNDNGELINPKLDFPVRQDLEYGDSILVIRNNDIFTGFMFSCSWETSLDSICWSYKKMILLCTDNSKLITLNRHYRQSGKEKEEIQVYYSRVVLVE